MQIAKYIQRDASINKQSNYPIKKLNYNMYKTVTVYTIGYVSQQIKFQQFLKNKKNTPFIKKRKSKLSARHIIKDKLQPFCPCILNKANNNKTTVKTIRAK